MEKILILGLSKSGIAAAEGVNNRGGNAYISEYTAPKEEFIQKMKELESKGFIFKQVVIPMILLKALNIALPVQVFLQKLQSFKN